MMAPINSLSDNVILMLAYFDYFLYSFEIFLILKVTNNFPLKPEHFMYYETLDLM